MEPANFSSLLTLQGQETLQAAMDLKPRETDFLRHFQVLNQQFPPEMARAGLAVAILRGEAAIKFPQASQMYFTRNALQQASSYEVSSYRAERYRDFKRVIDLGCSIGGDTLAFAGLVSTIGIDLEPLRLAMAQANLTNLGLSADFIQGDLTRHFPLPTIPNTALFFDPARRVNHRRIFSVRQYSPPLSTVREWLPNYPAIGVKISPGVKLDELAEYDAEIEFISLKGELKEAVLWFGPLKSAHQRATVLPDRHSVSQDDWPEINDLTAEPLGYLYEPDAAILRAGLVQNLAAQLNAYQLDSDIAYLTARTEKATPFARVWQIEDWFPFQLKRLRAYLRERGIGRVVVKKRGSPLQPEKLIRDLRLQGEAERVIFLTHLNGRPIVIVGIPQNNLSL